MNMDSQNPLSQYLATITTEKLDQLGCYPHLKKQIQDALAIDSKPGSDSIVSKQDDLI